MIKKESVSLFHPLGRETVKHFRFAGLSRETLVKNFMKRVIVFLIRGLSSNALKKH
jgi:hypothetical protein